MKQANRHIFLAAVAVALWICCVILLIAIAAPAATVATEVAASSPLPALDARGSIPGLGKYSTYAAYYGRPDAETLASLKEFDLVIVHPGSGITAAQVAELQGEGVIVLGYVSVGEEPTPPGVDPITGDGHGPVYYSSGESCHGVKDRHCEEGEYGSYYLDEVINATGTTGHDGLPDVHAPWNSYYADPASSAWWDRVRLCDTGTYMNCNFYGTDYVIDALNCDGILLDTVDTASPWHTYAYTLDAMADLICNISSWYPDRWLVLNRGLFYVDSAYGANDKVRPCVNGVVFENYYSEGDRDYWASALDPQCSLSDGCTVFALDYLAPTQQISIAHQISETVERRGWLDYVSSPLLDIARWEVWSYCHQVIRVTTTDDELNSDGDCSLREAIEAANLNTTVDACIAGWGDDTIVLPAGTYTLTLSGAGEDANLTGDLDIIDTQALTITGAGPNQTVIDANSIDRVLDLHSGAGTVVISGTTILNGSVGNGNGGGIYTRSSDLSLLNTVVAYNSASYGGGVYQGAGSLTLDSVQIIGNSASGSWPDGRGGGLYIDTHGSATLTSGEISRNTATNYGGGVYVHGWTAAYGQTSDGAIADNSADHGGGVYVLDGSATLGGQISSNTASRGGGLYVWWGRAMLDQAHILNNFAQGDGGGLYLASASGAISMTNSCIVNNSDISVVNASTGSLEVVNSWWGDANGPLVEVSGCGESVSRGVQFLPLRTTPDGCPRLRCINLPIVLKGFVQ